MSEFLTGGEEPSPVTLKEIQAQAKELEELREVICVKELALQELKTRELKLSSEIIPTILLTNGLSSLKLANGGEITITEDVKTSLIKDPEKQRIVLDFIRSHGGESIIKNTLAVKDPSQDLINSMIERNQAFSNDTTIHPQTLKAFYKDLLGLKKNTIARVDLKDVPKEANVFIFRKTKIK